MLKCYAGIGARKTPNEVLDLMHRTAVVLAKEEGYFCNTGAAKGADQAFAEGAASVGGAVQLFLPWESYEKDWIGQLGGPMFFPDIYIADPVFDSSAFISVDTFHPAPEKLTKAVKALHARNWLIINKVQFVICWTPNGEVVGGTGQAIRIAESMNIRVYNLGSTGTFEAFKERLA